MICPCSDPRLCQISLTVLLEGLKVINGTVQSEDDVVIYLDHQKCTAW